MRTRFSFRLLTAAIVAAGALATSAMAATSTFQQGVGGYSSGKDTYVQRGGASGYNFGGSDVVYILSSGNANAAAQGLMLFDSIFGAGSGQVPAGQTISSATLTVNVEGSTIVTGNDKTIKVFPMLQPVANYGNNNNTAADLDFTPPGNYEVSYTARGWSLATSWQFWGGGASNLGDGPVAGYDYDDAMEVLHNFPVPGNNTLVSIDVTGIVNAWYSGALANNGFFLRPDDSGYTGIYLTSNDSSVANVARRPQLSITYAPVPEPASLGLIGLAAAALLRPARVRRNG